MVAAARCFGCWRPERRAVGLGPDRDGPAVTVTGVGAAPDDACRPVWSRVRLVDARVATGMPEVDEGAVSAMLNRPMPDTGTLYLDIGSTFRTLRTNDSEQQ